MKRTLTQPAPLLRLAVAMAAGIVAGGMVAWPLWVTLLLLALTVAAALAAGRWPFAQSALIVAGFALLGMARLQMSGGVQDEERAGAVRTWFLERRDDLLARYRQVAGEDDERYAVLAAMTLGDKRALTRELRETYSITGASHVLALSGLHLGIVYLFVSWLMAGRRRFWLSQVIIILSLWAFALLTGLSVSVVRSASMLSIYALFSVAERGRASVNVLAFTAIVLLLTDARTLYDVGFQMSFAAVLSILVFMPLADALVSMERLMRHRWLRWVYGMVAVSVAAQLGVAPLIAFYFHRFSTYFLLSNFVVIPAATLILYGALAALVVPPLMPVLLWVVQQLNAALTLVARLPLASIDGLCPSLLQVSMVYVAVGCLYLVLLLGVKK